jgi:hypothetical protein
MNHLRSIASIALEGASAGAAHAPVQDLRPPGMRSGRSSDNQRADGCKDMRTFGGLGCMPYQLDTKLRRVTKLCLNYLNRNLSI